MSTSDLSSTAAEKDARSIHDDGDIDPSEMAIGVVIGRASEAFDFFVFAIASVIVFPQVIFPFVDPLTGAFYSFAVFALAFMARPVGTVFFTGIDRRYGRGTKLTIALVLLGGSTATIAFMPGYETIGAAAVFLLCLLRCGQGFALGGTWEGLASLLALNAPKNQRGWYAMIPQLGAPIGMIVAAALFVYLLTSMSEADFLAWGWRYPFFVAFAINVVALFARLRLVVTPEYAARFEVLDLTPATVTSTISAEGRHILAGVFTPLAALALFHMVTVFPLSWVFLFTDASPAGFLVTTVIAGVFGLAATYASGVIADRIGRETLLLRAAIAIGVFSFVAPWLLNAGRFGELVYMIVGFILLGLSFGQSSGAVASRFAPEHRYTASALTSDLAWLFGAGFAPLVALFLSVNFGLFATGAYLLSGAVCTYVALRIYRNVNFVGDA